MPALIGVWGQFPQYRAREGAVEMLQDRINGCMERSMNGRALPLGSREMTAFSSYMRWLSTGVPDGAKLIGAGTRSSVQFRDRSDCNLASLRCRSKNPRAPPIPVTARRSMPKPARHATVRMVSVSARKMGLAIQFPPLWGPDSFNNGAGMSRLLTAAAYAITPTSIRSIRAVRTARRRVAGNSGHRFPISSARAASRRCVEGSGTRAEVALLTAAGRLAAQRDSVIADNVIAHEWVLLIDPAAAPPVTPLTLSSPTKATPFRIIPWHCSARFEHRIARPRRRIAARDDLALVEEK
jgi:hypothetical protein